MNLGGSKYSTELEILKNPNSVSPSIVFSQTGGLGYCRFKSLLYQEYCQKHFRCNVYGLSLLYSADPYEQQLSI
jgi:hypothetical protein